ncbi:MAG: HlyC/CorC family transporter [Verrucomicrobiales bacterium]|nr:HlyC/CorC family transporter [Verrucomicrobiales bacterium]
MTPLLLLAAGEGGVAHTWDFSGSEFAWRSFAVIFFVLLNAFFVAAEFAIVKVRSSQLEAAIADGSKRAVLARKQVQHLDGYLSATQLGITLASIALGMIGEPFMARVLEPAFFAIGITSEAIVHTAAFLIGYGVITFLHVVLGELMPKSLAIRKSLATTLTVAAPLHLFYVALKPGIWVLNGTANALLRWFFKIEAVSESELAHSEEELRHIVAESERSSEVTETEKDILLNALSLNDRCVRDIMTPRNKVISLDLEDDFKTNLKLAIESKHTRFPLVQGHLDNAQGLIHIKDLLPLINEDDADLRQVKRELLIVPEMLSTDQLLHRFREHRAHLALAIDEYGGAVGIVTFDNIMEEIVGDILDEFDEAEQPEFVRSNDTEFTTAGALNLYELEPLAGLELESDEVTTIGGYVTHMLGHLPKTGEQVRIEDYVVTVTKADNRHIIQLHFRHDPKQPSTTGEDSDDEGDDAAA